MESLFYKKSLSNHLLLKFNHYNLTQYHGKAPAMTLSSTFNTFKGDKNPRLIKLYNLLLYIANQRPFIKKVDFKFIKKKILKKILFSVRISKQNLNNFINYLHYYLYFYQIYFLKPLKYNSKLFQYVFYLDNVQLSFKQKARGKISQSHIKLSFASSNNGFLTYYLNNFFLI